MNLLLDTHTLIWFGENDPQLSNKARSALELSSNTKYVSVVSFWELAIKYSLGKLQLTRTLADIIGEIEGSEALIIGVLPSHTLKVAELSFFHRDPFDRMLIAQAITEDFILVSNETLFDEYGVNRLW